MRIALWTILPLIAAGSLIVSGCTSPLGSGGRYALDQDKDQGSILLDTATGDSWIKSSCPGNDQEWSCWKQMSFDKAPGKTAAH